MTTLFRSGSDRLLTWIINAALWVDKNSTQEQDGARLYCRTWHRLHSSILTRSLLTRCKNKYALDTKEHLHLRILTQMLECGIKFKPRLSITNPDAITEACDTLKSFIVVSVHNGLGYSTRSLLELDRDVAVIVSNTASKALDKIFKKSGINKTHVHLIPNNKLCLFAMRDAVISGKVVSCNIDFRFRKHSYFNAVSTSLFEFANKMCLPVFFARFATSEDGDTSVTFDGPHQDMSPEQYALNFANFIRPSRLPGHDLTVFPYDRTHIDSSAHQ